MGKVRRIDWSPDEWIAGTFGVVTIEEAAAYMAVLMSIYSRGGNAPNSPAFFARHFKNTGGNPKHSQATSGHTRRIKNAIDGLILLGKLRVSNDGQWLTNGRAHEELAKANDRIDSATKAGLASGAARRAQPRHSPRTAPSQPHSRQPETSKTNGLSRTPVSYHQPSPLNHTLSESLTVAAREPSPEPQASQARAPAVPQTGAQKVTTPLGPPDPAAIAAVIRDLGVDPAAVEPPPAPALTKPAPRQGESAADFTRRLLTEKALEARRKLMGQA